MRIERNQNDKILAEKIRGYYYSVELLDSGVWLISKYLDGQLISQYVAEIHGFCSCLDFQKRRAKGNATCKHLAMIIKVLAENPEPKETFLVFFDENLKKLL